MNNPVVKPLVPPGQPLPRLGRYRLIGKLATGGMAEVFLARHGELSGYQTLVVVKRVLPNLASNEQFTKMFLDEARIAAQLDHPNIVRIIEVARAGEEYFLAMELVQGKPLSALLSRASAAGKTLPHPLMALVVAQAAAGLQHAHAKSDAAGKPMHVVHRDVSPHNLLVSFEGAVKVIDFGIARARGRMAHTSQGDMKGKLGYMSPEQARGEAIDSRTDVFALGVVLWECLTGRLLFDRDTAFATMRAIVEEDYPKPSAFGPISPALEEIVMRALAKDADQRFASARELETALQHYIFRSGVVTNADLAATMTAFFADDQVRWKETVKMALEIEPPGDGRGSSQRLAPVSPGRDALPTSRGGIPVVGGAPHDHRYGAGRRRVWLVAGGVLAVGAAVLIGRATRRGEGAGAAPAASAQVAPAPAPAAAAPALPPPAPSPPSPPPLPTAAEIPAAPAPASSPSRAHKRAHRSPASQAGGGRIKSRHPAGDLKPNPFE